MESIDKWYSREVLRWRTGAAVVWSVLYVPAGCLLYTTLSQFSIYPLTWITNMFGSLFSWSFVVMVTLMMVVNGIFYVYSSKTFAVIPATYTSRLSQLTVLCKAPCLAYASVCVITGMILARLVAGKLGNRYAELAYKCAEDSDLYCINEHHLFLVLYGGYTGMMYMVYHYVRQHNLLQFPTLQQAKYFQVRTRTLGLVWSCLGHVIWHLKFYYIVYYLLGHIPRNWIVSMLSLKYGSDYTLDSLYGLLLDLGLLWQSLVLGLFIQFSWGFGALLYKVYNTEHYEFPLSSMFDNYKNKCLVDALSCTNQRLVQALGFYDLNLLSKHSHTRRRELFSLSQPGGHPHNWNKIIAVCLSVINELSDSVRETNWKILANAPVRHPSTEKPSQSTVGHKTDFNGVKDIGKPADSSQPTGKLSLKDKILNLIQKKKPVLNPAKTESPEVRSRNLFASAFIQIWAVEAVSALVAASYQEDSFGVVQMSLKDILIAMLSLQEDIDKHFKLSGGVSRRVQKEQLTMELPLKYSLQNTLKSSIYRVVNTFGKHLLDVGLPPETEKKLKHFLEYKE